MNTSETNIPGEHPQPVVVTSASGVPNPMAAAASAESIAEANKRTALAGQWRTPPTPFFASGYEQQVKLEAEAAMSNPVVPVPVTTSTVEVTVPAPAIEVPQLPHSTEDYAKALQEAYRRGAEAAARAAAQQMASVTSCPDLQHQASETSLMPPPAILPAATSDPSIAATEQQHPMQVQVQMVHHHHHHHVAPGAAAPATLAPPPPQQQQAVAVPPVASTLPTKAQQTHQQRSVSLPDMSSYAAQQEEEKRQKRLARNRASARLRRLRKKNLVDAYETEVGFLEKTIQQLQQHEWGATNSASALAEALGMDRGQQRLTAAERCQAATDILSQQLQFLQQLEDLMQEQYVLQQMALCTVTGSESDWKDLQDTLQLSPEQCQQLVQQSAGWDDEWNALQTVKTSLQAMKENDWLWNEGCSSVADQFLSILHNNQISKFLLWADHNAETIEELDGVHAVNAVADSPIFQFGVDSNPNEMLDDDKSSA
jgi:hypothetical protein